MASVMSAAARLHTPGVVWLVAALITIGGLGQAGAWFAASARLPFVAGLDRYLPPAFGRVHPRWGSPYVAILAQAVIAAGFIFVSLPGTTVAGAYEVLVSLSVAVYLIPYVFMFAALIRLQRQPAGAEVIRVPGGSSVAIVLGLLGLATTLISILLSMVPSSENENKPLFVVKVVGVTTALVLVGALLYFFGERRRIRSGLEPPVNGVGGAGEQPQHAVAVQ
jgi:amino acid transporter